MCLPIILCTIDPSLYNNHMLTDNSTGWGPLIWSKSCEGIKLSKWGPGHYCHSSRTSRTEDTFGLHLLCNPLICSAALDTILLSAWESRAPVLHNNLSSRGSGTFRTATGTKAYHSSKIFNKTLSSSILLAHLHTFYLHTTVHGWIIDTLLKKKK